MVSGCFLAAWSKRYSSWYKSDRPSRVTTGFAAGSRVAHWYSLTPLTSDGPDQNVAAQAAVAGHLGSAGYTIPAQPCAGDRAKRRGAPAAAGLGFVHREIAKLRGKARPKTQGRQV